MPDTRGVSNGEIVVFPFQNGELENVFSYQSISIRGPILPLKLWIKELFPTLQEKLVRTQRLAGQQGLFRR